jgi:pyruvate dehydrogenase E1 component alpha subunit
MRDAGYRTTDEVDEWKLRDPIALLRAHILVEEVAGEADLSAIDDEITSIVADALAFAEQSPFPDPSTAAIHIYGKG